MGNPPLQVAVPVSIAHVLYTWPAEKRYKRRAADRDYEPMEHLKGRGILDSAATWAGKEKGVLPELSHSFLTSLPVASALCRELHKHGTEQIAPRSLSGSDQS